MIIKEILVSAVGLTLASLLTVCQPAALAQGQPSVSVVNLQVQPGNNGGQLVVTPNGYLVPLPGAGVNGNVVEIYMGSNGGFWYTDRTGNTVDLTSYVAQVRAQTEQAEAQKASPPEYAPAPSENSSGGSGIGTAAVSAAAAGLGAMAGAAIANTGYYKNVPYGTPMYYAHGHPYYNDDHGRNVFVNEDGEINTQNVVAAKNIQDTRQQQKVDQLNAHRSERTSQAQAARSEMQATQGSRAERSAQAGGERFQHQEQWYQEQSRDHSRAESWQKQSAGENPFVRQGSERHGQRNAGGDGGRRNMGGARSEGGRRGGRRR